MHPHIGLDLNLLTVAGKKIFKDIRTFSGGSGQGVVILDLPIDPWSATVLNKCCYAWADKHDMFYGGFNIHIQIVTAATIMGTIKVAFVPRLYSTDFVIEQSNLDALNPIELACNVNGEGTIRCIPTSDEYARTGIYRRSTMSNFGRMIGITATNIYNSFAADAEVQVKIACSLIEGSKYIEPPLLRSDVPDTAGAADLDTAVEDARAVLVVDGQHHDEVDCNITKDTLVGKSRLEFAEGTTNMDVVAYPKVTTFKEDPQTKGVWKGEMYPIAGHGAVPFNSDKVYGLYEAKMVEPDSGTFCARGNKVDSPYWLQWMQKNMHGNKLIVLSNVTITPRMKGAVMSCVTRLVYLHICQIHLSPVLLMTRVAPA